MSGCQKSRRLLFKFTQVFVLPSRGLCRVEDLSKHNFWKEKYSPQNSRVAFDWFLESHKIYPLIEFHIEDISQRQNGNILTYAELGCGTSELPLVTFKESQTALRLILTDFIMEALHHQASLFHDQEPKNELSSFHLICADVLKLPVQDNSLQLVVDKGTMDALLKDRSNGTVNAKLMTSEVMRALGSGGRYVQVTDEDPDSRLLLLDSFCDAYCKLEHDSDSSEEFHNSCSNNSVSSNLHCKSENQDSIDKVDMNVERKSEYSDNWSFKVISGNCSEMEYFMYWIDKR